MVTNIVTREYYIHIRKEDVSISQPTETVYERLTGFGHVIFLF